MKNYFFFLTYFFPIMLFCKTYTSNGSSGIGSASIPITQKIISDLPIGWAYKKDNKVFDKSNNKPLLKITPLQKEKVNHSIHLKKLVQAELGSIKGFEFIPHEKSSLQNYWVICRKKQHWCQKIEPLSTKNDKILSIMGNLKPAP